MSILVREALEVTERDVKRYVQYTYSPIERAYLRQKGRAVRVLGDGIWAGTIGSPIRRRIHLIDDSALRYVRWHGEGRHVGATTITLYSVEETG